MSVRETLISKTRDGFTLLELLIAVTLLALLSVLLLGGLHFGSRVWERVGKDISQTEDLQITSTFLAQTLTAAYPEFDHSDPLHPVISFRGDTSSLHYLAPMPMAFGGAGFAVIDVQTRQLSTDNIELAATLRSELSFPDRQVSKVSTLISNIKSVKIRYFGSTRHGQPPEWQDSWGNALQLPSLIHVAIQFPEGDRRRWPDLVIAPKIDVDASCDYDALSQGCRGR